MGKLSYASFVVHRTEAINPTIYEVTGSARNIGTDLPPLTSGDLPTKPEPRNGPQREPKYHEDSTLPKGDFFSQTLHLVLVSASWVRPVSRSL